MANAELTANTPIVSDDETGNRINAPCDDYARMALKWPMLDSLLGGTQAMRIAGELLLPREPKEDVLSYTVRLNRSFLFNGYGDTVDKLSEKPFAKSVTMQGDVPEQLQSIQTDVDRTGKDITQFAKELMREAVIRGLTHILVDYPKMPPGISLAEEQAMDVRPVFVHIRPKNLIGWKSEIMPNGKERLTQIRILEVRKEDKGNYGTQDVNYIRVYNVDTWELWREEDGDTKEQNSKTWVKVDEGTHTFGAVPLETVYFSRKEFMTAEPPLEDLAWTNLAHWHSSSDQRACLRFARIGILFAKGFSDSEIEKGITIGPSSLVSTTNDQASLQYVEHDGKALGAGVDDLKKLEQQMVSLGLQPLVERVGSQTATQKVIEETKTHTMIESWVRAIELALENAYDMAAKWSGLSPMPDEFEIDVNSDFGISVRGAQDITVLAQLRQQGDLSRKTLLRETQLRGIISDSVDINQEILDIQNEPPPLGALGGLDKPPALPVPGDTVTKVKPVPPINLPNIKPV